MNELCEKEGSVIGYHRDALAYKRIKKVNFKNGTLEDLDEFPFLIRGIANLFEQEDQGDSIVWSNETAYAYDMEKKTLTLAAINGSVKLEAAIAEFNRSQKNGDQLGWKVEDLSAYDQAHQELLLINNGNSQVVISACIAHIHTSRGKKI